MSNARKLSRLIVGTELVASNVDSDLSNRISSIKTRLDSDDSKIQSLNTSLDSVSSAVGLLDSDLKVVGDLRNQLDSEIIYVRNLSLSYTNFLYNATDGQTTFQDSDANSATLAYTAGSIQVFLNGIKLEGDDYTATDGTSIVLTEAAITNAQLIIVCPKLESNIAVVPSYKTTNTSTGNHMSLGAAVLTGISRTYTIDMHAQIKNVNSTTWLVSQYSGDAGRTIHAVYNGKMAAFCGGHGGWFEPTSVYNVIDSDTIHHFAWVSKPDGSISLWLDGNYLGNSGTSWHNNSAVPSVTTKIVGNNAPVTEGVEISSFRINNTQLYTGTSNLTVPNKALPNVSGDLALWNGLSNPPVDTSGTSKTFTVSGSAAIVQV